MGPTQHVAPDLFNVQYFRNDPRLPYMTEFPIGTRKEEIGKKRCNDLQEPRVRSLMSSWTDIVDMTELSISIAIAGGEASHMELWRCRHVETEPRGAVY